MTKRSMSVLIAAALIVPTQAADAAHGPADLRVRAAAELALAQTVEGKATGTVLLAKHGRILWVGSIGDTKQHIPAEPTQAAYDTLSIGKTFTAIALQRLAAEGKIDLDAPLVRYTPELPAALGAITVQNCLDNASGWGAYLNDKGDFDPESTAQLIADLKTAERRRPVGKYGYSNTGFQALGLVVQRVTGRPFKQALQELVFRPAGLIATHFLGAAEWRRHPVAIGYARGKPTGSVRTWPSTWSLMGAAGIGSTVTDLFRLNRAYLAGASLGAAGRRRMLADGAPTGGAAPYKEAGQSNISYGSGLYHWRDAQGRRVHFHGGDGDFGFHAAMFWREDDDVFVVGLFNSGSPAAAFDRAAFISKFAAAADLAP